MILDVFKAGVPKECAKNSLAPATSSEIRASSFAGREIFYIYLGNPFSELLPKLHFSTGIAEF